MKFYCSKSLENDQQWELFWQFALKENWSIHSSEKITQRTKGILVLSSQDLMDDDCMKYKNLWILADDLDARFITSSERELQVFKINPESREDWDEFALLMQEDDIQQLIEERHKYTASKFQKESEKDDKRVEIVISELQLLNVKFKDIDFNADEEEIVQDLNKVKKSIKLLQDVHFYLDTEIKNIPEDAFVWKVPHSLILISFKSQKQEVFLAVVLLSYLLDSIFRFSKGFAIVQSDVPILFQHALQITDPIALMTEKGDLLYYNDAFSRLSFLPSDCLNLQNDQIVEIQNQFYRFKKYFHMLGELPAWYVFFLPDVVEKNEGNEVKEEKKTPEELGIISSSIAHELNNPIAGIIAATSVLELEDWDDDSKESLNDIKEGAIRCKKLIEIFLGFSRFSPHEGKVQNLGEIERSFEQALQLLRFRMIESDLRLELKKTPSLETFQAPVNFSVLSMIVYLILTEVLTAYEHSRLVENTNEAMSLNVFVTEFSQQLSLQFDKNFEFKNRIISSKLIQHLLDHEKLVIHFQSKEIKLVRY